MTFKEKRAIKLLVKSKWLKDYYYVVKVMYSCMDTNDTGKAFCQLSNAFKWGYNQLVSNAGALWGRHPSLRIVILDMCHKYMDDLFDIKWEIQDKINYETV